MIRPLLLEIERKLHDQRRRKRAVYVQRRLRKRQAADMRMPSGPGLF
jgi:hypothetical protein